MLSYCAAWPIRGVCLLAWQDQSAGASGSGTLGLDALGARNQTGQRQVNAESYEMKPWGGRTEAEAVRFKEGFPVQYRIKADVFPQELGGDVPPSELYDLDREPNEMHNLVNDQTYQPGQNRLLDASEQWIVKTKDPAVSVDTIKQLATPTPSPSP